MISQAIQHVLHTLSDRATIFRRAHVQVLIAEACQFTDVSPKLLVGLPDEMGDMEVGMVLPERPTTADEISVVRL